MHTRWTLLEIINVQNKNMICIHEKEWIIYIEQYSDEVIFYISISQSEIQYSLKNVSRDRV